MRGSAASSLVLYCLEITQIDPEIGQYIGYLDWVTDAGWQQYHGMLLSVQRLAANGMTVSSYYTWSHCISDMSGETTMATPGRRRAGSW